MHKKINKQYYQKLKSHKKMFHQNFIQYAFLHKISLTHSSCKVLSIAGMLVADGGRGLTAEGAIKKINK